MRYMLVKCLAIDRSCNKAILECGMDVQLGCYCGYDFMFNYNYGRWKLANVRGFLYKISEFGNRQTYLGLDKEFRKVNDYILLGIGTGMDQHLMVMTHDKDLISQELLK